MGIQNKDEPSILLVKRDGSMTEPSDSFIVPKKFQDAEYAIPTNTVWVEKASTHVSRNTKNYPELGRPMGAILFVPEGHYSWSDIKPKIGPIYL